MKENSVKVAVVPSFYRHDYAHKLAVIVVIIRTSQKDNKYVK